MRIKILFLLAATLALTTTGASAHRLHIDWKIGKIEIESFYGGSGTPCQDARVKVYTSKGELLEEGETNTQGKYSFSPVIWEDKYKVVLEPIHMPGHKVEDTINLTSPATSPEENKELPLFAKVMAGFGYLAGIAGISLAYISWREKRKIKEGGK